MDKLFSSFSSSVDKKYPKCFNHDECTIYCKDLIYVALTVKIHKDTV